MHMWVSFTEQEVCLRNGGSLKLKESNVTTAELEGDFT